MYIVKKNISLDGQLIISDKKPVKLSLTKAQETMLLEKGLIEKVKEKSNGSNDSTASERT